MTKVKAAMDQYIDGLESLDVLESVRKEPGKWKAFFVDDGVKVDAGMYIHALSHCIDSFIIYDTAWHVHR